jgi:hypothetical protein
LSPVEGVELLAPFSQVNFKHMGAFDRLVLEKKGNGNPKIETLPTLLKTMGLKLSVEAKVAKRKRA